MRIIKASAGSGKTTKLTKEYINLLIPENGGRFDREAYRHVLAVTFTNKATDEMKGRVVRELAREAARNTERGHRAKEVLTAILHDYSSFSISTIDRFFQGVMRAFAREIGEFASYKVELDSAAVIELAVDRMLASLEDEENRDLFDWLMEYSIKNIENGKRWDITNELKDMAKRFLSEDFKVKRRAAGGSLGNRKALSSLKKEVNDIIDKYVSDMNALGGKALKIVDDYNVPVDAICEGKELIRQFENLRDFTGAKDLILKGSKFLGFSQGFDNWVKKDKKYQTKAGIIADAYRAGLAAAVDEALLLAGADSQRRRVYKTALLLRDKLYILGIFSDLYAQMTLYLKENNLILLGETAETLSKIIDGNDTPFIYEKTGTRYDHYMLDEFQDTSRLQWEGFKPLIKESLSYRNANLIVGDIKQSIYRWRGGDLSLLGNEIEKDFPPPLSYNDDGPNENWRSAETIVCFNSSFFENIGTLLEPLGVDVSKTIGGYYKGSGQIAMQHNAGIGRVKVIFIRNDKSEDGKTVIRSWQDKALDSIEGIMANLLKRYDPSEITLLVRKNSEGERVASKLIELKYQVITEDSLNVMLSPLVRKTVCLLKRAVNPDDEVNNLQLISLFGIGGVPDVAETSGVDTSLFGISKALLSSICEEIPASEAAFVTAFLDSVLSYMARFGSDLNGFIEWWDSTGSKKSVSAPEGNGAVKVMTVHKAKGLSSPAIVIPLLKEDLDTSRRSCIWCSSSIEPFNKIGVVPLNATVKDLEYTVFNDDLQREKLDSILDSVNTAYVAMTRAVGDMIILAPMPENESKPTSVSDLLYTHLKDRLDENNVFEIGEEDEDRRKEVSEPGIRIPGIRFHDFSDKLRLSLKAGDYYDREAGIVRHDILARVDKAGDIARAVAAAVNAEELPAAEAASITAEMEGYLATVADRHWFDGTYRPLNEVSIVAADGSVFRPDRVLVEKGKPTGEGKALVIDYKFGLELPKHRKQVKDYMDLLRGIGYSDVSGYLWYCKSNKVVECD